MKTENSALGSPRTMASQLVDAILRDIITGVLPPGSKLVMRELGNRYQSSAIPLREAVSRLTVSGFVDAEDQRGFRVTAVSPEDLQDITTVRQNIECDALRDAIGSGDLAWEGAVLAALHQVTSLPATVGDPPQVNPAWEQVHDHFHATLLEGSRSKWLKQFATTLRIQTARYRHMSLLNEHASTRNVAQEHERIVKAILAHDADRACALLRKHFAVTSQLVLERLEAGGRAFGAGRRQKAPVKVRLRSPSDRPTPYAKKMQQQHQDLP